MTQNDIAKIDFFTFGVSTNQELLREIHEALQLHPFMKNADSYKKHELTSIWLLDGCEFVWNSRASGNIRRFFECCGVKIPLDAALKIQKEIESSSHKACLIAAKILQEYTTYQMHWNAARKHIKKQKQLLSSKRKFYSTEVEKRDGYYCRSCIAFSDLQLDHILPVSHGGLTKLENLQFLCKNCNVNKSNKIV